MQVIDDEAAILCKDAAEHHNECTSISGPTPGMQAGFSREKVGIIISID